MTDEPQGATNAEWLKEERTEIVAAARRAFGHHDDGDDVDFLCLRIISFREISRQRIEALNANAAQAAKIAEMQREIARLRADREAPPFDYTRVFADIQVRHWRERFWKESQDFCDVVDRLLRGKAALISDSKGRSVTVARIMDDDNDV